MKTWCEHIVWQMRCGDGNKGAWYLPSVMCMDSPFSVQKHWLCCPICGTKRPEENKKLSDVIAENWEKFHSEKQESNGTFPNFIAKAAMAKVIEVIEEWEKHLPTKTNFNELKRYLKDELL